MRRYGSRVTVVEQGPQLANHEDPDVTQLLMQRFVDEGIEVELVELNARPIKVSSPSDDKVIFRVHIAARDKVIEGSDMLVAA